MHILFVYSSATISGANLFLSGPQSMSAKWNTPEMDWLLDELLVTVTHINPRDLCWNIVQVLEFYFFDLREKSYINFPLWREGGKNPSIFGATSAFLESVPVRQPPRGFKGSNPPARPGLWRSEPSGYLGHSQWFVTGKYLIDNHCSFSHREWPGEISHCTRRLHRSLVKIHDFCLGVD